jgi:hypothetical protein
MRLALFCATWKVRYPVEFSDQGWHWGGDVFLVPVFCMTAGAESLALILMSVDGGREEIPDIVGGSDMEWGSEPLGASLIRGGE